MKALLLTFIYIIIALGIFGIAECVCDLLDFLSTKDERCIFKNVWMRDQK